MCLDATSPFSDLNSDRKYIYDEIIHRKIRYLVHFTSVNNLKSILENGIVPRGYIEEAVCNDDLRLDNTNYTCMSIEFPNHFLLSKFEQQYLNRDFCILKLDFRDMLEDNITFFYVPTNAATSGYRDRLKNAPKSFSTYKAFKLLFEEQYQDSKGRFTTDRNQPNMQSFLPTNVQSEVLTPDVIDLKYIETIIFDDSQVMRKYENMINDEGLTSEEDSRFFFYREKMTWKQR